VLLSDAMDENLILGGTGKTGRRVAQRLRAAGIPVRTAARSRADVVFDLGNPETWVSALEGVRGVYLVEPDLGAASVDGARRIPAFVTAAVAAGARRLVILTAGGADYDGHPLKPAETAVCGAGVGWTILRPTWFAQNFSEDSWRPGIVAGSLVLPTGDGQTPFIDAEDIAEVAAAALTQERHHGQTYALTGPRAISFGEAADLIAKATGRAVHHTDIDPEAYIERQVALGVPPGVARMLTSVLTAIRDGHDSALADGVERALDRPPTRFEDYVTRTAASGGWD